MSRLTAADVDLNGTSALLVEEACGEEDEVACRRAVPRRGGEHYETSSEVQAISLFHGMP